MNSNTFLLQALKSPMSIGAVAPSSQRLCKLMIDHAGLSTAKSVVELGPGTGSFTKLIVQELAEGIPFLCVERNEAFAAKLAEQYSSEKIALGSAEQLSKLLNERGLDSCDRVISGLPWMVFSKQQQESILAEVAKSLTSDGVFLTYAYLPFSLLPKGQCFYEKLKQHFGKVEKTATALNFPPAFIYICSEPLSKGA